MYIVSTKDLIKFDTVVLSLHVFKSNRVFYTSFLLQAAFMRGESELMGRRGMTHRTRVRRVFAVRALSGVRESAVHPPTVSTQSRGSAACPVMVSY